jgi:branched-chain amino acid transport system permease protein
MEDGRASEGVSSRHGIGRTVVGRRPRYGWVLLAGVAIIVAGCVPLFAGAYYIHLGTLTFIYMAAAASLRTIVVSGQFPLAHAGFMGIGAYVSAIVTKTLGWPPLVCMVVAAVATTIVGMLMSVPFSRLRTVYYAMGSLFFGIGIVYFINAGGKLTNGATGLAGIAPLFPHGTPKTVYYYFFLALLLIGLLALHRFEFCRIGTNLKAIAQSDLVAASVGINVAWYRVLVVGVGCFVVGLIGAGYAHYVTVISPNAFNLSATLWLVMYVIVGGMNHFAGPIVGTAVLFLLPEVTRSFGQYSPYFSGALVLIVAFALNEGLVSVPRVVIERLRRLRHKEEEAHAATD